MFGKKVQNLIQILRLGKSITKGNEFHQVSASQAITKQRSVDLQIPKKPTSGDQRESDGENSQGPTQGSSLFSRLDGTDNVSLSNMTSVTQSSAQILKRLSSSRLLTETSPETLLQKKEDSLAQQLVEQTSSLSFQEFK